MVCVCACMCWLEHVCACGRAFFRVLGLCATRREGGGGAQHSPPKLLSTRFEVGWRKGCGRGWEERGFRRERGYM